MLSWAVYPALDPRLPAGLSSTVIHGELRGRLAFRGVTITDAIGAGALNDYGTFGRRAVSKRRAPQTTSDRAGSLTTVVTRTPGTLRLGLFRPAVPAVRRVFGRIRFRTEALVPKPTDNCLDLVRGVDRVADQALGALFHAEQRHACLLNSGSIQSSPSLYRAVLSFLPQRDRSVLGSIRQLAAVESVRFRLAGLFARHPEAMHHPRRRTCSSMDRSVGCHAERHATGRCPLRA